MLSPTNLATAACLTCNGTGQIKVKVEGEKRPALRPCPACSGRGKGYATK